MRMKVRQPEAPRLRAASYSDPCSCISGISSRATKGKVTKIVAGTPDAVVALQSDGQMSSRFFFLPLPVWRCGREFRQLLAGFELLPPLAQPSLLSEMQQAARLHR